MLILLLFLLLFEPRYIHFYCRRELGNLIRSESSNSSVFWPGLIRITGSAWTGENFHQIKNHRSCSALRESQLEGFPDSHQQNYWFRACQILVPSDQFWSVLRFLRKVLRTIDRWCLPWESCRRHRSWGYWLTLALSWAFMLIW